MAITHGARGGLVVDCGSLRFIAVKTPNVQGNPAAAPDVEDTKTVQPPLGLTGLLGVCSVAVRDLSDAEPHSIRRLTVRRLLFVLPLLRTPNSFR